LRLFLARPTIPLPPAQPKGGSWPEEPAYDRAARQAAFEAAVAQRCAEDPWLHPCTGQRELNAGPVLEDGGVKGIGLAGAMRRTALRALAVAALALAGLLVFGLLPGGRDAGAVVPSQHRLPAAPTVQSLHPHGPNRPLRHG
jgi:hypothetical protein